MAEVSRNIYRLSRGNLRPCTIIATAGDKAVVRVGRTIIRHARLSRKIPRGGKAFIDLSETPPVIYAIDTPSSVEGASQKGIRIWRANSARPPSYVLGSMPRYIPPGETFVLQIDPGSYNDTLVVDGFYGGGTLVIRGDPADDVWTNQAAQVSISPAQAGSIYVLGSTTVRVVIERMGVGAPGRSSSSSLPQCAVGILDGAHAVLRHIIFTGSPTVNSLVVQDGSFSHVSYAYFNGGNSAIYVKNGSRAYVENVDDITNLPSYGIYALYSLVNRGPNVLLNGSTADVVQTGGQVW